MRLSPGRAAGLAFLTAAVTLLLQILVHRMVSAKLLNNYAFLVISHTMLGFALSGVVLSFKLRSFLARLADAANLCAALLVVSLLVASIAFYHSEAQAHFGVSRPAFVVAFFRWMPYALLYALPFAFSGLTLGALLAAPELPARRIYFWDLLGSAVGAFAAIPAIQLLGVEWSTLALCAASCSARCCSLRRLPDVCGSCWGPPRQGCWLLPAQGTGPRFRLPRGLDARDDATSRLGRCPRARGLGPARAHRGVAHPASRSADNVLSLSDR